MGSDPASGPTPGLHPAQNRSLRECHAAARQLQSHWSRLSRRIGPGGEASLLEAGARAAGVLLDELGELTAGYDLFGSPAAQGVGVQLAAARNLLADRALERNQALRLAVLDVQHLTTLLAYLAELGDVQRDEGMSQFCGRWERRLRRHESALRRAAVGTARDPGRAIEPLERGPAGRAAHGAQHVVGSLGEWFDRRAARLRRR
jgi:hypothetical protein